MKFLFTAGSKASKTAFFATILSAMVVGLFPFVALGKATYPSLTAELLMIFWGAYIGSNKAKDWVAAAKNGGGSE
jgi:hypothetical protein